MKLRKGFAAMDPERRREIASQGGKAAHAKGTAHEFTSSEARAAAMKGASKGGRRVASIAGHMAKIGRRGGEACSSDPERRRVA